MLRDAFACEAAGTFKNFREVAAGALQVLLVENGATADQKQIAHVLDGFSELQPRKDVESAFRKLQEAKFQSQRLEMAAHLPCASCSRAAAC